MEKTGWTCEEDVLCGVNVAKDEKKLSELEKRHLPIIDAPKIVKRNEKFKVKVEVGKLLEHSNVPEHFIEWVELYCGDTFIARSLFNGGTSFPYTAFTLKLNHAHGPLKVWAKCNLEGLWENKKEIKIID